MFKSVRLQARSRQLAISYSKDWVLVTVTLIAFAAVDRLEPFHRQFSVKDLTIQHPYAKQETVPIWLAFVLGFIAPAVFIILIALFHKRSYVDLHNGLLGLFLAQALVLMVTDSVKIAVGRPRPDFLDRCLSLYDNQEQGTLLPLLSDPPNLLSNSTMCTNQELLRDGFKSFPSGHASFSFGGLGYLSMYLAGKLHLFDERGHTFKSIVVLTPLIAAALIATSRVADYRHHWHDVTVGSILGCIFAVFAYRQYYPSLAAAKSGSPFKPRVLSDILPSALLGEDHQESHPHRERPVDTEEDFDLHDHHHQRPRDLEADGSRQSFLSNAGMSFHRDGTLDTLAETSMEDLNKDGSKYVPGQAFEQASRQSSFTHHQQQQQGQSGQQNYGPLSPSQRVHGREGSDS